MTVDAEGGAAVRTRGRRGPAAPGLAALRGTGPPPGLLGGLLFPLMCSERPALGSGFLTSGSRPGAAQIGPSPTGTLPGLSLGGRSLPAAPRRAGAAAQPLGHGRARGWRGVRTFFL